MWIFFSIISSLLFFPLYLYELKTHSIKLKFPLILGAMGYLFCIAFSIGAGYATNQSINFDFYFVDWSMMIYTSVFALIAVLVFISAFLCIYRLRPHKEDILFLIKAAKHQFVSCLSVLIFNGIIILLMISMLCVEASLPDYAWYQTQDNIALKTIIEKAISKHIIAEKSDSSDNMDIGNYYIIDPSSYPLLSAPAAADDDDYNIVVIGDSFVMGYGILNENNLFWRQLGYELERRGHHCNIYPVGIAGASTIDEYAWIAQSTLVKDLKPDIVIIGYVVNDPVLNASQDNEPYEMVDEKSQLTSGIQKLISESFPKLSFNLNAFLISPAVYNQWHKNLLSEENLSAYSDEVVEPLAQLSKKLNLPIVVMPLPVEPDYNYYNKYFAPIEKGFSSAGIPVYNPLSDFCNEFASRKHKNNYIANPLNDHPGTATSYFYSQFIADFLEKDYLPNTHNAQISHAVSINDYMPLSLSLEQISSSVTSCEAKFVYPDYNDYDSFCRSYSDKDNQFVMLNFEYPVDIDSICISGKKLQSVCINYYSVNPELGYDDLQIKTIGQAHGNVCTFSDNSSDYVTSLCINATLNRGARGTLSITITAENGGVSLCNR